MSERSLTGVVAKVQFSHKLIDDILAATADYRTGIRNIAKSENVKDIDVKIAVEAKKAYCMKCRNETEIRNPREVYTRNGKPAIEGSCSLCGSNVYRIGRK